MNNNNRSLVRTRPTSRAPPRQYSSLLEWLLATYGERFVNAMSAAMWAYYTKWWNSGSQSPPALPAPKNSAPVAINYVKRVPKPRFQSMAGGVRIVHREYFADVVGNTTFGTSAYNVQPGLPTAFPWLSQIANNFEKYKFKRLTFHYVNISATSERGRVTLALDKDALDDAPATKAELFQYEGAAEGSVWDKLSLNCPHALERVLFTRNGTISNSDLKTYDIGKLIVAVSNTADTSTVGELFVEYEVELSIPQPKSCPAAYVVAGGTISKTAPYGSAATVTGSVPATVLDSTITFNAPGVYLVWLRVSGTAPGSPTYNTGTSTVATTPASAVADGGGGGYSSLTVAYRVSVPGQTAVITWGGTSVTAALGTISMFSEDAFTA